MNAPPLRARFVTVTLLELAWSHAFFGGAFIGFEAAPLPRTARLCQRLGLCLLSRGSDLRLVARVPERRLHSDEPVPSVEEFDNFCWQLTARQPDFALVTEPSFPSQDKTLFLSSPAFAPEGGRLTATLLDRRPLRFDCRPARPLSGQSPAGLRTLDGHAVLPMPFADPRRIFVDTRLTGTGPYELFDGSQSVAKWFADERAPQPVPAGAVLVLGAAFVVDALGHALATRARDQAPRYHATFEARRTVWRYHIFNPPDGVLSIEQVSNEATPAAPTDPDALAFALMPESPFAGASSFQSKHPLTLRHHPPTRPALRSVGVANRLTPLPLPAVTLSASRAGDTPVSDIFVRL